MSQMESESYLFRLFQMRQRFFGMFRAAGGITFLTRIHSPFQVLDALFHVHIGFFLLRSFRVRQGDFGMLGQSIGMALLAMVNGFLGMFDSFLGV